MKPVQNTCTHASYFVHLLHLNKFMPSCPTKVCGSLPLVRLRGLGDCVETIGRDLAFFTISDTCTWKREFLIWTPIHINIIEQRDPSSAFRLNHCTGYIWASTQENLFSVICEQQRRRQACASAQSNQHLFIRYLESIVDKLAPRKISLFLASLCIWGDWFETRFVGNPEDRFSRDEKLM